MKKFFYLNVCMSDPPDAPPPPPPPDDDESDNVKDAHNDGKGSGNLK